MLKNYVPLNYFDINGIIRQNPNLKVKSVASATYEGTNAINVLNSETYNKCWHSGPSEKPGATISITFEDKWVYITKYSIQSPDMPGCTPNGAYPKVWQLYGCQYPEEGINSCHLISNISQSGLSTKLQIIVYNISKEKQDVYKNFKFVSTGVNYLNNEYALAFQSIDFLGTLCDTLENCFFVKKIDFSCVKHIKLSNCLIFISIIYNKPQ